MMKKLTVLLLMVTAPAGALLAQSKDHPPVSLSSSSSMAREGGSKSESWTYRKEGLKLGWLDSIELRPTAVYAGPDAQFDDISSADRVKYAGIITKALHSELAKDFRLVTTPGNKTLRIQVTLVGVKKTTGGVATVSRVTPIGLGVNAIKSIANRPGTLTGSMLIAIEAQNARTGELQLAAVRRIAPDALDISATTSTSATIEATAKELARTVRERLLATISLTK